eukprot:gene5399-6885_t
MGHRYEHKLSAAGMLITLGIIYGDIGTSPLYVLKAIIGDQPINADSVKGAISSAAIEGLEDLNPAIKTVPIVIAILTGLFFIQQFGTNLVGKFFGPAISA